MVIRKALWADIPRLTELARELHQASKYRDYKEDEQEFKDICMESIRSGDHCLFVIEAQEVVEGFIIGMTAPLYVFTKAKYATDLLFYATEKGRAGAMALAAAFDKWAREDTKVAEVWLGVTNALVDDWRRFDGPYGRMGYELSGGIFMKRIER